MEVNHNNVKYYLDLANIKVDIKVNIKEDINVNIKDDMVMVELEYKLVKRQIKLLGVEHLHLHFVIGLAIMLMLRIKFELLYFYSNNI